MAAGDWRQMVRAAAATVLLGASVCAAAQRATPVPQLDLDKLTGTWYQIARLPENQQKKCESDGTVLYALYDKRDSFQRGIFCVVKGGDRNNINDSGTQSKQHDGKLRIRHWILFHRPSWVLATAPDFRWALVGTPNHKEVWVLSRDPSMEPELYRRVEGIAAAQGYPVAKLMVVAHPKERIALASPSANPEQIVTKGTDPAAKPTTTSPPPGGAPSTVSKPKQD